MAIREISNSTYDYNAKALTFLIYGAPGSGKSYFIGTMPNVYIVSLDRGLLGLTLAGKKFNGCEVDTLDELNAVIDEILNGTRGKGAGAFALDHLTEVTELGIRKTNLREKAGKLKRSTWGEISDHVRIIVRKFADIARVRGVPICVAAHQQLDKDEVSGNILGTPDTVGKFAQSVGGFFDVYLYARQQLEWNAGKQVPKWTVSTVDYLQFQAKDRTTVLDIEEPNDFPTLQNKVLKRLEETKKQGD